MRFSALRTSRVRLLALLLVAIFSFAAVGATTIASATDASAAKKCKKGYKKVGNKCKKKKATSKKKKATSKKKKTTSSEGLVTAVHVYGVEKHDSDVRVAGDIVTKGMFVGTKSVTTTVVSSTGTQTFTRTVKGWGHNESNFFLTLAVTGDLPMQVTASVEGKTSSTFAISAWSPFPIAWLPQ
jgi:hypothetical protein